MRPVALLVNGKKSWPPLKLNMWTYEHTIAACVLQQKVPAWGLMVQLLMWGWFSVPVGAWHCASCACHFNVNPNIFWRRIITINITEKREYTMHG